MTGGGTTANASPHARPLGLGKTGGGKSSVVRSGLGSGTLLQGGRRMQYGNKSIGSAKFDMNGGKRFTGGRKI